MISKQHQHQSLSNVQNARTPSGNVANVDAKYVEEKRTQTFNYSARNANTLLISIVWIHRLSENKWMLYRMSGTVLIANVTKMKSSRKMKLSVLVKEQKCLRMQNRKSAIGAMERPRLAWLKSAQSSI